MTWQIDRKGFSHYQNELENTWRTHSDEFRFSLSFQNINVTLFLIPGYPRIEVLQVATPIFDPFAILSEYSLMG